MTHPVLLGGAFIGILSALPIVSAANFCCCLWVVTGGMLASYLTQQVDGVPIAPGRGALVGFRAGIVGALVWVIVAAALTALLAPLQQQIIEEMIGRAQRMPPQYVEWLERMAEPGAAPARLALEFVVHLFAAVFAAFGGLLGAVLFGRKPPSIGQPVPPPLPPQ